MSIDKFLSYHKVLFLQPCSTPRIKSTLTTNNMRSQEVNTIDPLEKKDKHFLWIDFAGGDVRLFRRSQFD